MCGRYALYGPYQNDEPVWHENWAAPLLQPLAEITRYNMAPSQMHPVVCWEAAEPRLRRMRWGLIPGWAREPKVAYSTINARAESVLEKPSYRSAWRSGQRCLVPITGWYEWQDKGAGLKQAYYFHTRDIRNPMMCAGLWSRWQLPDAEPLFSYTIITTEAVGIVREVHTRQPRVLSIRDWQAWLVADVRTAEYWLKPESIPVSYHQVGNEVGNVRRDDAGLIQPVSRDDRVDIPTGESFLLDI